MRIVGSASLLGLGACAAIAGLEAPGEDLLLSTPDRDAAPTSSSSTSAPPPNEGVDAALAPPNDAATSSADAGADADAAPPPPPPPPCTKTPNGGGCLDEATCCSKKCNEAQVCAGDCKGAASTCDPTASAPCCIGLYCSGFFCAPCIGPGGTPADSPFGGKNPKSCCSRTVGGDGKCQ